MDRIWKLSLVSITLILLDQFSKGHVQSILRPDDKTTLIEGFIHLVHIKSYGFSTLIQKYRKWSMIIENILLFTIFIKLMVEIIIHRNKELIKLLAYSLFTTGILSSLIDRFFFKYVVNIFELSILSRFHVVFNIADLCFLTGCGFWIAYYLKFRNGHSRSDV